jgi:hypothetical protein
MKYQYLSDQLVFHLIQNFVHNNVKQKQLAKFHHLMYQIYQTHYKIHPNEYMLIVFDNLFKLIINEDIIETFLYFSVMITYFQIFFS